MLVVVDSVLVVRSLLIKVKLFLSKQVLVRIKHKEVIVLTLAVKVEIILIAARILVQTPVVLVVDFISMLNSSKQMAV